MLVGPQLVEAQTIAEKKASLAQGVAGFDKDLQAQLQSVNSGLAGLKEELRTVYQQAEQLFKAGASATEYQPLLDKIRRIRSEMDDVHTAWVQQVQGHGNDDGYALWNQPETTLEQLVFEYGALDHVYLIPTEIGQITITLASNLAVPRESWPEMLEWVLAQNGIGIKQINPYLRELYRFHEETSHLVTITNQRQQLELYPDGARVCFVLATKFPEAYRVFQLLEKFADGNRTTLQLIGSEIFIVSRVADIRELLKVFDFVQQHQGAREYRIVGLKRISAEEMVEILESIFHEEVKPATNEASSSVRRAGVTPDSSAALKVMALKNLGQTLFLLGLPEEVSRAEEIIAELEQQLGQASEKIVYRYVARHTEAEELAQVLSRVYSLIITTDAMSEKEAKDAAARSQRPGGADTPQSPTQPQPQASPATQPFREGLSIVVAPDRLDPSIPETSVQDENRQNFIVDKKTGSIVMVVDAYALEQMKSLIRKLDVPKKMVRVEVLLFEKSKSHNNQFGLSNLAMGTSANDTRLSGFQFNSVENSGIMDFFLSRTKQNFGVAIDLSYRFLLARDDVQVNASPSVVTVNQTPASIKLVEERSINTGPTEIGDGSSTRLQDSFVRGQFGITIEVTPTVHTADELEEGMIEFDDYITLKSNITFDTTKESSRDDQPVVDRRNIVNEVRIADGQSVILGGLRRKEIVDGKQMVPFLGEIPGFGKLFANETSREVSKELFVMLTPRIIRDPLTDFERVQEERMRKRPGDLPELLERLYEARRCEKERIFDQTLDILFDNFERRAAPSCPMTGEFNGKA